jgi:hypothetical protein
MQTAPLSKNTKMATRNQMNSSTTPKEQKQEGEKQGEEALNQCRIGEHLSSAKTLLLLSAECNLTPEFFLEYKAVRS